jgi:error-prone DNA polymerase
MTLEDETGIANVIVTPRHFEENRAILRSASAILVEGVLQRHDGVVSVKGQRFTDLAHLAEAAPDAHLLAPLAGHDGSTAEHDGAEHRTASRRTA